MATGRPEEEPKFQDFSIEISCGLCRQTFTIPIKDTNLSDARANAVQTALLVHVCPAGTPGVSDFTVK